jgi:hypothetical protein
VATERYVRGYFVKEAVLSKTTAPVGGLLASPILQSALNRSKGVSVVRKTEAAAVQMVKVDFQ